MVYQSMHCSYFGCDIEYDIFCGGWAFASPRTTVEAQKGTLASNRIM